MQVYPARIRSLSPHAPTNGPVVYWMHRDQRADDNWALLAAAATADQNRSPLHVVFTLAPAPPETTARHMDFMLTGLAETEAALREKNIPLVLLAGDPVATLPTYLAAIKAGVCVTDFSPMRNARRQKAGVAAAFSGQLLEVDAHNVVPCFVASPKREYTAATFRPKLHRLLPEFLTPFPEMAARPQANLTGYPLVDFEAARAFVAADPTVPPVADVTPGSAAAKEALERFVAERLPVYAANRNDPNAEATSGLSPYFHFGHLAPQRAALAALSAKSHAPAGADAFLEELIVRRELADNFCHYQTHYDSFAALPDWARKTLTEHADDPRPYGYEPAQFEAAATHSALWNAAERQLLREGRIHGYLRMYWAKKILEWSATPTEAIQTALWLNDRHALDGSDPNGVVGVLWSVGGLHDRPWATRPVFGQVRYMNERGCRRKFDVAAYIDRYAKDAA
ncbi:MAG: deoxyribodipyrimidine photo-lyase [Solidesulfovibrio sp.]